MTTAAAAPRSTAQDQRPRITRHAVEVFARAGYHATPVTEIAAAAQVSPAYVFRLFPGKLGLFVAAVDACYDQVAAALVDAGRDCAAADPSAGPEQRLAAMTAAYVELIRDRDLIALQSHAQSACDVPEIREAVRRGLARVVEGVTDTSGASPSAVQHFMAYGQLCHLIVQSGLDDLDTAWAHLLTAGIAHPGD